MDDTLAHEHLSEVLDLLDRYEDIYDRRWGYTSNGEDESLDTQLHDLEDEVRGQTRFARDVVVAMGEDELAPQIDEHSEVLGHWFQQARKAIVQAISILANREKLARITGPVGPKLSASELHPVIWGCAAKLWDDGHHRQAVQAAGGALEAKLQAVSGPGVSGQELPVLGVSGQRRLLGLSGWPAARPARCGPSRLLHVVGDAANDAQHRSGTVVR